MIIGTVSALVAALGVAGVGQLPVDRPCKFEDSKNCVWDARHRGNGEGSSFVVSKRGKVVRVTHKLAHGLLND
jgi:hypothetical protein